jgi:hypothetical protein
MSENAIDGETVSKSAPNTAKPKGARKPAKKTERKKSGRAEKPAAKPKTDRTNKKAEVIAMIKRAKGATLRRDHEGHGLAGAHGARLR